MSRITALFLFFMLLAAPAAAEDMTSIFDILNETYYTGDWSSAATEYNFPPACGCSMGGAEIITGVWCCYDNYRHRYHCSVYLKEYRSCMFKEWEQFGETICYGEGCWVNMVRGSSFYVTESCFNKQSNVTKERILRRMGGVVDDDWQPFYGDPKNPYDCEIQHRGVVWGYVQIHFDHLSMIDGEYCIPNSDAIKISSGAWNSVGSRENKKKRYQRGTWFVKKETSHSVTNGVITAKIDITVKWYQSRRNGEGVTEYQNTTSHATFYDSAPMPRIVPSPNASATIVSYNNSISPYSLIEVHIDENITMTEITHENKTAKYHNRIGVLDTNEQYKYFAFGGDDLFCPDQNDTITMRAGYYVINEAPLGALTINVSTPYGVRTITDYNVTVINSTLKEQIGYKEILAFLAMLAMLIFTAISALRYLQ